MMKSESYFVFRHVYKDENGFVDKIELFTERDNKDELLKHFENFLRCCGFVINGEFYEGDNEQ